MADIVRMKHEPRTDADVRLLLDRFKDCLPDGRILSHETIESALTMSRDSSRYKTVIRHWRRILFQEQRVFLDGRSAYGHGFKALTPDEMVRYANREVRAIGRKLKRAIIIAATPADSEIADDNNRIYRARLLSATEQIAQAHGRVVKDLSSALRPPKQIRAS